MQGRNNESIEPKQRLTIQGSKHNSQSTSLVSHSQYHFLAAHALFPDLACKRYHTNTISLFRRHLPQAGTEITRNPRSNPGITPEQPGVPEIKKTSIRNYFKPVQEPNTPTVPPSSSSPSSKTSLHSDSQAAPSPPSSPPACSPSPKHRQVESRKKSKRRLNTKMPSRSSMPSHSFNSHDCYEDEDYEDYIFRISPRREHYPCQTHKRSVEVLQKMLLRRPKIDRIHSFLASLRQFRAPPVTLVEAAKKKWLCKPQREYIGPNHIFACRMERGVRPLRNVV